MNNLMKLIAALFLMIPLFGTPSQKYFDLLKMTPKTHGNLGNFQQGKIEVIINPIAIQEIEEIAMKRLIKKKVSPEEAFQWSRIGIIAEDQYLYWLRDGVIFPSGEKGTYDRILWKACLTNHPGVAIFPYLPDKKVILNLNYRHATRSWELELPRGMVQEGESPESAAIRELLEETGYHANDTIFLGNLAPDSGILGAILPVFACKISNLTEKNQEFSEAIYGNPILTPKELESALLQGFYNISLNGKNLRAHVRDPFLAFALLQMKLRHWEE